VCGALILLVTAAAAAPADAQIGLDFARQLYNQGRYDQAISAAVALRTAPGTADVANLILGRARLERFRSTTNREDLVAGRESLCDVRPERLGSRDRIDYLVGLGESLYLDESYGAAAELFDSALERSRDLSASAFDRVFDWWATALDRQVQAGLSDDRDGVYARIRDRARTELATTPGSGAAAYWLVVSYRSLGDLGRAWDAAVAGWVRAPLTADQGVTLREDLDRLMLQAVIPERVRQVASSDRDRERAAAALRSAWEGVKKDWSAR
jgi:tetratricopeptide (TPR) repeat protein